MDKKAEGNLGEELAAVYLLNSGYEIIARNFKCKCGELDIIARRMRTLSFIEVKTRTSDTYGMGREAVDEKKRRKIRNASNYFLLTTALEYDAIEFDVIEITLEHLKDLIF